ncbi:hypothetical protein M9Y10_023536 [Tritrichomonas musculus]|uniref:Uncharacterized protein n=1 Tax=Tritrichomonas musculus TaxID=1915356 RepID=A0ABR2KVG7_9EUKA
MGLSEILMKPFQKWFNPPIINTPFSTITLPPSFITISLLITSFFIICSGIIFCYVRNMPMVGAIRRHDGSVSVSWIDLGSLSNQFLAEGMIASLLFTISACSIIASLYIIQCKEPLSEIQKILKVYGYSSPFWCFCSFLIFRAKIPSFFPMFHAR